MIFNILKKNFTFIFAALFFGWMPGSDGLTAQNATGYIPKSATTETEHQIVLQYGQNQLFQRSFRVDWGGRGYHSVETFQVPHFELSYARWFHERNYVGATFRTGEVHYQVNVANDPLWAIYNPAGNDPITVVDFQAWHLYHLGVFWRYDFIDEFPLIRGKKRDLIFHSSVLLEGGVNLMSEAFSREGTYSGPAANGDVVTWGYFDHRTIRTTQIRYGFRSRSSFTLDKYALLFDFGINQGFRDFHFFQIESNPVAITQPYFDLRNSLSYFFWNVGLGYWF